MVLYGRLWDGMGAYYRWVLSTDGCEAPICRKQPSIVICCNGESYLWRVKEVKQVCPSGRLVLVVVLGLKASLLAQPTKCDWLSELTAGAISKVKLVYGTTSEAILEWRTYIDRFKNHSQTK